ncbi:hypothetical protein ACETRX_05345 [Labrys portucalensis]|uniref:Chloride channel protein n=1 Tax=Labrys neptuniae TaxID=376174 RepID=A0ABV6ZA25_9HYPH
MAKNTHSAISQMPFRYLVYRLHPLRMKHVRQLRPLKIALIAAGIAGIGWQIAVTEWNVNNLRTRGFEDFVIEGTRMHAYFPLFGGIIGSAVSIFIVKLVKDAWKSSNNN